MILLFCTADMASFLQLCIPHLFCGTLWIYQYQLHNLMVLHLVITTLWLIMPIPDHHWLKCQNHIYKTGTS